MPESDVKLPKRFELGPVVGQGRFAEVYRADDSTLGREIALKISTLKGRSKAEEIRIRRELRISCKLRHPGIVSAYDGFATEDYVALILPLISGGTLEDQSDPSPSLSAAIEQFRPLAGAVAYLHKLKVVHGDLKPGNVLVDHDRGLYLADFGSCHLVDQKARKAEQSLVGSPAYLAPELLKEGTLGAPTVTSDLYALGAVFFYLYTGHHSFTGTSISIIHSITTQEFPTLRSAGVEASADLEAVIAKACHREPSKRYDSASDFLEDLVRVQNREPVSARRVNLLIRTSKWASRNQLTAFFTMMLFTVILIGTVASAMGWATSISKRKAFEGSEATLVQQGKMLQQRESELKRLLDEISRDRKNIDRATKNGRDLLAQAETSAAEAQRQAAIAKKQKEETQQTRAEVAKLSDEGQVLDVARVLAERISQRKKKFVQQVASRHSSPNSMDISVFKKSMEDRLLPTNLSVRSELSFRPERLVFNRQGTALLALGKQPGSIEHLSLNLQRNSTLVGLVQGEIGSRLQDIESLRNGVPINAAFCAASEEKVFVVADASNQQFVVMRNGNRYAEFPLQGQCHALIYPDEANAYVVRSLDGDVEVVQFPSRKVVYSCQNTIESFSKDPSSDEENENPTLAPYFMDCGTDPGSHLLFATSESMDEESDLVLHSVAVGAGDISILAKHFDCGIQDLRRWPDQMQLSKYVQLGVGHNCLANNHPAPLSHQRFRFDADDDGYDYRKDIRMVNKEWRRISFEDTRQVNALDIESELHLAALDKRDYWLMLTKAARLENKIAAAKPKLDWVAGVIQVLGPHGCYWYDGLSGQSLMWKSCSALTGAKKVVWASQGNSLVGLSGKSIQWNYLAKWRPEGFAPINVVNERLGVLASRVRNKISLDAAAMLAVNNGAAESSPNSETPDPDLLRSAEFFLEQDAGGKLEDSDEDWYRAVREFSLEGGVPTRSRRPLEFRIWADNLHCFWKGKERTLTIDQVIEVDTKVMPAFRNAEGREIFAIDVAKQSDDRIWVSWGTGDSQEMGIGVVGKDQVVTPVVPVQYRNETEPVKALEYLQYGTLFGFDGHLAIGRDDQLFFSLGSRSPNVLMGYRGYSKELSSLAKVKVGADLDTYHHDPDGVYVASNHGIERYEVKGSSAKYDQTIFELHPTNRLLGYEILSPDRLFVTFEAYVYQSGKRKLLEPLSVIMDFSRDRFSQLSTPILGTIGFSMDTRLLAVENGKMTVITPQRSYPTKRTVQKGGLEAMIVAADKSATLPESPNEPMLLGNSKYVALWSMSPFNGKDLREWIVRSDRISVRDGAITGAPPSTEGEDYAEIRCQRGFKDFELSFEVKFGEGHGNSGVLFRGAKRGGFNKGYQFDMTQGKSGVPLFGLVYSPMDKSSVFVSKKENRAGRKGEWNSVRLRVYGSVIEGYLNGKKITDFRGMRKESLKHSRFGFEFHHNSTCEIQFRKIRLTSLGIK